MEDHPFQEGIDGDRDAEEAAAGAGAGLRLSDCEEDNRSPKSCYGCIHWAHSRIVVVACHPGPAWTEILLLSHHFRWERLPEVLFPEDGQDLGEDGGGEIECVVRRSWISSFGRDLFRVSLAWKQSRMDLNHLSHLSHLDTPDERIRQGGKTSHSATEDV